MTRTAVINYLGVELTVEGDWSPVEPETQIDPGCPASFDPFSIKIGGIECWEMFICLEESGRNGNRDCLTEIRIACLEQLDAD